MKVPDAMYLYLFISLPILSTFDHASKSRKSPKISLIYKDSPGHLPLLALNKVITGYRGGYRSLAKWGGGRFSDNLDFFLILSLGKGIFMRV